MAGTLKQIVSIEQSKKSTGGRKFQLGEAEGTSKGWADVSEDRGASIMKGESSRKFAITAGEEK